jgi:AcrR family transcriptional regulator
VAQFLADSANGVLDEVAEKLARQVDEKTERLVGKVGKSDRLVAKVELKRAQAAAKIEEKRAQAAAKVEEKRAQAVAKVERHRERHDRLSAGPDPSYDFWTRERPGTRQPRFSHETIAEAALQVVDAEGIDALSMRRLAAELNAGTMTIYHYVRTKDELFALLADRVMSELILDDDEFPAGWREALTAIARRTREVMMRHPWMFDAAVDPSIGPNGLRHFDQSLQAVASLGLDFQGRLDILTAVDEYVFGHCLQGRNEQPVTDEDWQSMSDYVIDLAAAGDHPQIADLVDEYGAESLWRLMSDYQRDTDARFERNLTRILDGIERDLPHTAD